MKTEAEYEQDKALLNGGDVIKVDFKDFSEFFRGFSANDSSFSLKRF